MKAVEAIKDFMMRAEICDPWWSTSHTGSLSKDFEAGCQRALYKGGSIRATGWCEAKLGRCILQCDGNLAQDVRGREQGRRRPH